MVMMMMVVVLMMMVVMMMMMVVVVLMMMAVVMVMVMLLCNFLVFMGISHEILSMNCAMPIRRVPNQFVVHVAIPDFVVSPVPLRPRARKRLLLRDPIFTPLEGK